MSDDAPQVDTAFIALLNGSTLYRERWRSAHHPPTRTMVLIHGLSGSTSIFYPVLKPLLSALPTTEIIAYDWSASGLSHWPRVSATCQERVLLTYPRFVEDLEQLITQDVPPTGPLILVAHSGGSLVAAHFLLSHSSAVARVTHTIFLAGPINPPDSSERAAARLQMAALLEQSGPWVVADAMLPLLVGRTTLAERPASAALVRAVVLSQSGEGYGATLRAFIEEHSKETSVIPWERLPGKVKLLVVHGDEDALFDGTEVPTFLPRAVVRKVSGAGHTLTAELPEETATAIANFVSGES